MKQKTYYEKNEFELSLGDFFYCFKRFWLHIVAVALIASVGIYLYISATFVPTYTADVKICVFNSEIDDSESFSEITNNNEYTIAASLTQSYMDILNGSRDYLNAVIENLGISSIGYTAGRVRSQMSVGLVGQSENLFYIKVTDASASMASLITEEIVDVFFKDIVYAGSPFIVDDVPTPQSLSPSQSPALRNSALSFVLVFAFVLVLVTIICKNDSRLRSASDIESATDYPVLGVIPYISSNTNKSSNQYAERK